MSAPASPIGLSQLRDRDITWRSAGIAFALLAGWITFLFRDTVAEMVDIWNRNETFTHCFLIAPISLWLIWRMRDRIAALPPKPSAIATLALPFVGALWLASAMAYVNAAAQFAYVCMLIVAAVAVCGLRFARMAIFPLAFLFLAIPVGEFALPTMMEWTADFTVAAVRLSGIPVYREGQQFVIPSGSWSVVEACSGVRYLIASYTVGALYAYLNYRSFVRRAIFFAFSVLVPIVANWLRAYLIVMLGHLSSNRLAVGVDHLIYGWLL